MDRKPLQNHEILRLTARSAAARNTLGSEVRKFQQRLDVVSRVRDSLFSKPASWLLGSTIAGLAAGALFPRFRRSAPALPPARNKGTLLRILGMAWSAAQPFVKSWVASQVQSWIAQRALSNSTQATPRNQSR